MPFSFRISSNNMTPQERENLLNVCSRLFVTLILLGIAVWLFKGQDESEKKIGALIIGAVTGYWLK